MFFRRSPKQAAKKQRRSPARVLPSYRPFFERLEDRTLLDGSPTWVELGPKPVFDEAGLIGSAGQNNEGRVSALAIAGNRILVGAAGGGVWTSDNYSENNSLDFTEA